MNEFKKGDFIVRMTDRHVLKIIGDTMHFYEVMIVSHEDGTPLAVDGQLPETVIAKDDAERLYVLVGRVGESDYE